MLFKRPNITYSIPEFCEYMRMGKVERVLYDFSKEMDQRQIDLSKNEKLFKTVAYTFALFMTLEKTVHAAPSTGFDGLDNGAWKIVQVIQACVFWVSLLYTLKSLLLLTVKGEGEWKKVATGFLICVGDYLVPWLFGMVPGLFKF
ncbi:hypothetical protein [Clostridium sp. HMP27]|uniref:hypothetical protein n=1 Tax=Clostridium sp. HMP27 TaxID=1487921 RepID=UPI00052BB355|nr:hypothetical protein [Clostridium sp. HMP27]KGK88061.1 hypothetical protein DP68_09050 [Clostridium sp. HMP27]